MTLKPVGIEDDGSFVGRAKTWLLETMTSQRIDAGPKSSSIHGSHTLPQHTYVDGLDLIGGIEGAATPEGNSWVTVDVLDHKNNVATRVPLFQVPVDDHSPAAVIKNPGCPAIAFAVAHQVNRQILVRSISIDSKGNVTTGDVQSLGVPAPTDTGGNATYIQAHPLNPDTAYADGYTDLLLYTRISWHWFVGPARFNHDTKIIAMTNTWKDFITFRDPGAAEPGGDQGYINTYRRVDGLIDVVAFGHPVNADDRNLYMTTVDPITGDVGGRANIYTGVGLPLTRRSMELGYRRKPNTNVRCLGLGGLAKRQALIATWTTTNGSDAAVPSNTRYKLITRGVAPAVPGAVVQTTGHISSADRPSFDVANVDLQVWVSPTSTRPTAAADIGSKWEPTNNQRSWRAFVNTDGTVAFSASANGTALVTGTSTVPMSALATDVKGIRVTYASATGAIRFYTSTDGLTWTQLGADVAIAATALFDSNTSLKVGRVAGGVGVTLAGTYRRWTLYNGVGGTLVADLELNRGWYNGEAGTSRVDNVGSFWALQSGVVISVVEWAETADMGPSGDVIGYTQDIQYIADGAPLNYRDDAAILSRRMPGGLARTVIARVMESGTVVEEVLAEALGKTHFRPRPVAGEGGPLHGSVSQLNQYGPTYVDFNAKPVLLWHHGPTVPSK
jgi:hypothetical protein